MFTLPQRFVGPPSIFDVDVRAIPFDNRAALVAQGVRPEKKPTIDTVITAHPGFYVDALARYQTGFPVREQSLRIVGMDDLAPTEPGCLFVGHSRIIEPTVA